MRARPPFDQISEIGGFKRSERQRRSRVAHAKTIGGGEIVKRKAAGPIPPSVFVIPAQLQLDPDDELWTGAPIPTSSPTEMDASRPRGT